MSNHVKINKLRILVPNSCYHDVRKRCGRTILPYEILWKWCVLRTRRSEKSLRTEFSITSKFHTSLTTWHISVWKVVEASTYIMKFTCWVLFSIILLYHVKNNQHENNDSYRRLHCQMVRYHMVWYDTMIYYVLKLLQKVIFWYGTILYALL